MQEKAFQVTNVLLGEGKPTNWNTSNVEIIGLTNKPFHLSESKVNNFTMIKYQRTRELLDLHYDFYFRIIQQGNTITNYGLNGTGKQNINLRRNVFYKNDLAIMEFRVWQS